MLCTKPWKLMMIVVDTNVLVYASNEDSPFHGACRHWLEQHVRRADAWYTTWPILYEFMRVVTHRRALSQPWSVQSAWNFVVALLAAPGLAVLVPTQRHPDIAAQLFTELPQLSGSGDRLSVHLSARLATPEGDR